MGEKKVYSFLNDFVFKCVFGQQKNAKLLISLLNAITHRKGPETIEQVQILNPFAIQEFKSDKLSVVDVKARSRDGSWFTIEVQVREQEHFASRAVYYLAKLYGSQLLEGEDFSKLGRATGISILDFDMLPESRRAQSIFRLRETTSGRELTDIFELHFIELPKLEGATSTEPKTKFERWMHILKYGKTYCGGRLTPRWVR